MLVPWNLPLLKKVALQLDKLLASTGDSLHSASHDSQVSSDTSDASRQFVAAASELFLLDQHVAWAAAYLGFATHELAGNQTPDNQRDANPPNGKWLLSRSYRHLAMVVQWLRGFQELLEQPLETRSANRKAPDAFPLEIWTRDQDREHPILHARECIHSLSEGSLFSVVLEVDEPDSRSDELSILHRYLKHTVELIVFKLRFHERLDQEKHLSVKRLAYGASHEINNPLANIATRAQTLLKAETDPQRRYMLQMINAQAFRAFDMLANLMHYANPPLAKLREVELTSLLRNAIQSAREHFPGFDWGQVELKVPSEGLNGHVDVTQFNVLIHALLRNAVESRFQDNPIVVSLTNEADGACGKAGVLLEVADSGLAVPVGDLSMLCDPFYSGREAGRGLGFGLAKARAIAEAHGGEIHLQSRSPRGLRVMVWLPIQETSPPG